MPLTTPELTHLVAALLTVNQYPVDKAASLMPAFGERGLLDPVRVAGMSQGDVEKAMADAGYARGGYLPIVSYRLFALMDAAASGGLDALPAAVVGGNKTAFVAALSKLHGFGPKTAEAAWLLWGE